MRPRKVVLLAGTDKQSDHMEFIIWTWGYTVLRQEVPPVSIDCVVEPILSDWRVSLPSGSPQHQQRHHGPVMVDNHQSLREAIAAMCARKRGPKPSVKQNHDQIIVRKSQEYQRLAVGEAL